MTTNTPGTTDIGYAKQKQYETAGSRRRRHAVVQDGRGLWVTRCTGKPATREYKGWATTVSCQACAKELGIEMERQ